MKAQAVVYGHDGFDRDVTVNLLGFYRRLGVQTRSSRYLIEADLLIVERPPQSAKGFDRYSRVHFYDYVGADVIPFLRDLEGHAGATVFTTSAPRQRELLEAVPGLEGRVRVALPPVLTSLWTAPLRSDARLTTPIHIGNYKPYYSDESDAFSSALLDGIRAGMIEVWGAGWVEKVGDNAGVHGPLRLAEVSPLYARAALAVGMMYPFQREVTFSGRFWQAPLNGCTLYSEPSYYAGQIPGVEVFESLDDLVRATEQQQKRTLPERTELKSRASNFWDAELAKTSQIVGETLEGLQPRRAALKDRLVHLRLAVEEAGRSVRHGI